MTFVSSRSPLPVAIGLRYDGPNTVRVGKLNNDDEDRAEPNDPNDNPSPIEGTEATVEFTVFSTGRSDPFADYDHVPMPWAVAVGDEPACYKASLPAVTVVRPGQYYGEITITVPGFSPERVRLVVTVAY
jgi:hypothetical protein